MLPSTLISSSVSVQQLSLWLDLYPENLHRKDSQGRLPLHYAVLSRSPDALDMVRLLLQREKAIPNDTGNSSSISRPSCETMDQYKRLPLHYAAAGAMNKTIIQEVLEEYIEGLTKHDIDERLPWHYAECARQDIIYEQTLSQYPEIDVGDLELVPEEIRWDVLQVVNHDAVL